MDFPDQKRDSSFWAIEVSLRTCLWPIAQVNILHVVKLEKTSFILEWFLGRGEVFIIFTVKDYMQYYPVCISCPKFKVLKRA